MVENKLYQLLHPWHWLTWGNNAAGVGSVAAVVGLYGLWRYVLYTKGILEATIATQRAAFEPVLDVRITNLNATTLNCILQNVGRGYALHLASFEQHDNLEHQDMTAIQSPGVETEGDPINSLKPDETANIALRAPVYPKGASTYFFIGRDAFNSEYRLILHVKRKNALAWESRIYAPPPERFAPVSALEGLKRRLSWIK